MINIRFDMDKAFAKEMNNLVQYSLGFVEGVNAGKHVFFATIGEKSKEIISSFVDSMARQDPNSLHHVYEWYQAGSPEARLFDITYTVSNLGLSLKSTFRQSTSIKNGSKVPFYNKANIMESGMSVTIRPKNATVLSFEQGGEQVFTSNPIQVESPGGRETHGSFERAFDLFVNSYFSQAFMQTIGISKKFGNLEIYSRNLRAGLKGGKPIGVSSGYRWVANLGVGV
jgi:hypothetical protein